MSRSYLRLSASPVKFFSEAITLYKFQSRDLYMKAREDAQAVRRTQAAVEKLLGASIIGRRVVEIGPGQKRAFSYAWGWTTDYTGIDIEVAPKHLTPLEFIRICRQNGVGRAVKTAGRRVLGLDRAYADAMRAEFGVKGPGGEIIIADAAAMPFEDESVDIIVSVSVFEHLEDPATVMAEVARVLKPGGVAYIVTHLYTSINGAHDPRVFIDINAIPAWAHLRPEFASFVRQNSYLNQWRLAEYLSAFEKYLPGSKSHLPGEEPRARELLDDLRQSDELQEYSDEELLRAGLVTIWQKSPSRTGSQSARTCHLGARQTGYA